MTARFSKQVKRIDLWALAIGILLFLQTNLFAAQVTMAWDANVPTPDGYRLYQRLEGGTYDYNNPVWSGTATNCIIGNLAVSTTYYYTVHAFVGAAESGDSNEVSFRNDPLPTVTYTINATAGNNGSITPSGATSVQQGASQTFSIEPAPHCHINEIRVDDVSVEAANTYTFNNVQADHTIAASFAADTFVINASAGPGGVISPSGSLNVVYGGSAGYAITANTGYHVADVRVDGISMGALSSYTFESVSAGHTIAASFAADTFVINASAGPGGTISPSGHITLARYATQTFTIQPDNGYQIQELSVDGQSLGALNTYTFSNISSDHSIDARFALDNQPPVADAGPDQNVSEGQQVILSGLNSNDADDGIAQFAWRQLSGPVVTLASPAGEQTNFTAPDVGVGGESLVFQLTVTDYSGVSAADTCIVNVSWVNLAPTAQAGANQSVAGGTQVTLDGTNSVDPDDGIATYNWQQIQGPQVILDGSQTANPTFTAPDVGSNGASLTFQLTVIDNNGLQDTDTCIVTVAWSNTPPTADAGPDQQADEDSVVFLDGSNSQDVDDGVVSYRWRQTDGPPVVLSDATAITPSFTVPTVGPEGAALTFQLTVTDQGGLSDDDICIVNITGNNQPPVADAGDDQVVVGGATVTLDGSQSMDNDDGIAGYRWQQTSGASVMLADADAMVTTFTAPAGSASEILEFELVVIDNGGLQSTAACRVTVRGTPQAGDSQPPVIEVDGPITRDTFWWLSSKITLYGQASDDHQVAGVFWENSAGGSGQASGTTNWKIENIRLYRGKNVITLTAKDVAGNQAAKQIVINRFSWWW